MKTTTDAAAAGNPRTGVTRDSVAGLNPRWTYSTFIVGPSNRTAYLATRECLKGPPYSRNPIVLCGGQGLGKTHLLHACCRELAMRDDTTVRCLTGEEFMCLFIEARRCGKVAPLRRNLTDVDALFMDDLCFLYEKVMSPECLASIVQDRLAAGRLTMFTTDVPPRRNSDGGACLAKCLKGSLIVRIRPPDMHTAIAILCLKAQLMRAKISMECMRFIARHMRQNVRRMEGALVRTIAHQSLSGEATTVGRLKVLLRRYSTFADHHGRKDLQVHGDAP